MNTPNIMVVDDHPIFRRGVVQILREEWPEAIIEESENAAQLFECLRQNPCDVVILDLSLPDKDGLDCLPMIKQKHPNLPVVFLSMHTEYEFAVRALKLGAAGYLTKNHAANELVAAVRKVMAGGAYVSGDLAERLALSLGVPKVGSLHERLSAREFAVMRLLASGKTVSQIAKHLSLSGKTISTYRARILEKMSMETNAELTHYCVRHQLID